MSWETVGSEVLDTSVDIRSHRQDKANIRGSGLRNKDKKDDCGVGGIGDDEGAGAKNNNWRGEVATNNCSRDALGRIPQIYLFDEKCKFSLPSRNDWKTNTAQLPGNEEI